MIGGLSQVTNLARHRLQDRHFVLDLAFAAVISVLAAIDGTGVEVPSGLKSPDILAYSIVGVGGLGLVWRRKAPIRVLAVVTVVMMAYWISDYPSFLALLGLPAIYSVAVHSQNRRRAWLAMALSGLTLICTACVTILRLDAGFAYSDAASMIAYLCSAILVGVVVRNREQIFADTQRRASISEADRLAEAQRAVAEERGRIAREMHDVVAHGMSVIAVQAAAAQQIVHTDPDKAQAVLSRIENVGRESLSEMRRMLGVLRDNDESAGSLAPQPSLRDLERVIAGSTESGVATTLVITGDERDLSPGIELAAFRIIQEALTNVRKHGGRSAAASVSLCYGSNALTIEVGDTGVGASTSLSQSGGGNGLIGMRERVEIYNGEFAAGPRPGGGYFVSAVLPTNDDDTRPGVASATPLSDRAAP